MHTRYPLRSRPTLLRWLAPLRSGQDVDRNVFWVVTSLIAAWMFSTVVCDLLLHWQPIVSNRVKLVSTVSGGVFAALLSAVPLVMKHRFPRWAGLGGYILALSLLINNISVADDPVLASTALHILPVLALYLGWFWEVKFASFILASSVIALLGASVASPLVSEGQVVNRMLAVFTVFVMLVAFVLAAYLRKTMDVAASTDPLTGALNTRGMRVRLERELARARRRGEPLTVAAMDFDGFKALNDRFGHAHGDEVLRGNVSRWLMTLRPYDVVGRIGGDEFVLIFPQSTLEQATTVLRRLERVSTHGWSWGLTQQRAGDTVDTVLGRADEQLYAKKRAEKDHARAAGGAPQNTVRGHEGSKENEDPTPRSRLRQRPFSVMTASVGLMLLGPIFVGLLTGEVAVRSEYSWLVWTALGIGALSIAIAIAYGDRLPLHTCYVMSVVVLATYAAFAAHAEHLHWGLVPLYAMSILALYLGTFSGSNVARLIMITGLLLIAGVLLLTSHGRDAESERTVTVTAIVYSLSVCFILFELSAYLYTRSRILVEHDALTGVLNRHGLIEYGEAEVSRAERGRYPLSVVMLDCAGFKEVNDKQGHPAGDRMLVAVADHLVAKLSPDDILVRLGGDEFMLLLPYTSEQQARAFVHTILADAPMSMHVGVATFRSGDSLESLMFRADAELCAS